MADAAFSLYVTLPRPIPLPKKLPILVGKFVPLSETSVPTQPTNTNGISIESAIFPKYTLVSNGQTNKATARRRNSAGKNRPHKLAFHDADSLTLSCATYIGGLVIERA